MQLYKTSLSSSMVVMHSYLYIIHFKEYCTGCRTLSPHFTSS